MLTNSQKPRSLLTLVTHDGKFHTDELMAIAIIELWSQHRNNAVQIVRTRNKEAIAAADIVVDVGGLYNEITMRFDHHQHNDGSLDRPDTAIPYSSAGLVWKAFGKELIEKSSFTKNMPDVDIGIIERFHKEVDKRLILPIDANDNGVDLISFPRNYLSLTSLVSRMNRPFFIDNEFLDSAYFDVAKGVCSGALLATLNEVRSEIMAEAIIENAVIHPMWSPDSACCYKEILELETGCPWKNVVSNEEKYKDVVFVVAPGKNRWDVNAVPSSSSGFESRALLPKALRGLNDKELQGISGVDDAIFCHKGGFIAAAASKEGAIRLATLAIKNLWNN